MKFAFAQRLAHRPRVLRGGKAPLYWKRELSRLTEGLGSTPRNCNWVREIAETHPHLLSGPLLGTCLTAVTETGVVRSDSNDEPTDGRLTSPRLASNRGKESATEPTASSKRNQIRSPAVTSQRSEEAHHFETVSQLPRRAPDSLLRRAAPGTLNLGEIQTREISSLPHVSPGSPPVSASQKVTRSKWLQLVADRAAKRWISDWIFPPMRKHSSPAVISNRDKESYSPAVTAQFRASNTPPSASPATVEASFLPSLNDNWLLPIGGQQASPQLLASVVKQPRNEQFTPEKIHRNKQTFNGIDSERRSLSSAPVPLATEQRSFGKGAEFSRPLERVFDNQSPPLPSNNRALPSPLESAINSEGREQRASPDLTPTVLTPDLSALLPPASSGLPAVPVAANSARRIAWRDEVEAHGTDLSVLAAQMKRIIDEEARRHGIDV